jgi:hypothetical protein
MACALFLLPFNNIAKVQKILELCKYFGNYFSLNYNFFYLMMFFHFSTFPLVTGMFCDTCKTSL